MLTLSRESGAWQDLWFDRLPELLREGDVLVLNDSRVIPTRLFGVRLGKIGKLEVLLTEQVSAWEWLALSRPARRMAVGQELAFAALDGRELLPVSYTHLALRSKTAAKYSGWKSRRSLLIMLTKTKVAAVGTPLRVDMGRCRCIA